MLKFMYLAKRKPSLTPEGFTARWRQHGALAMSLPFWGNMLRYVQADLIRPVPIPGASADHDAVALTLAKDDKLFRNPSAEDAANAQLMLEDEAETFSAPIPPVALMVDEKILRNVGRGGTTAFLFFNEIGAANSVAEAMARAQNGETADRVVVNRVCDDLKMSDKPLLSYKAVVEISASDVEKLKAVLDPGEKASWRKADLTVIARETVLWDKVSEKMVR